jgi:acyl-CoA thioesterase
MHRSFALSPKGRGFLYEGEEDEWLLENVLEKCQPGHTHKLGGNVFWQTLAAEQVTIGPHRTFESLRSRYLTMMKAKAGQTKKVDFDEV